MICADAPVRFRLVDTNVGWDPYFAKEGSDRPGTDEIITGLYDAYGLRLNNRGEPQVSNDVVCPFVPPTWLAPGCRPGEWFLCGTDSDNAAILLQRDPCMSDWVDLRQHLADGYSLRNPIAIGTTRRRLAVIDETAPGDHRVVIWSIPDGRLAGLIAIPRTFTPHAIAFTACRELIVSVERSIDGASKHCLLRFDLIGQPVGEFELKDEEETLPKKALVRLRTARDGSLWAAEGENDGPFHLWRIAPAEVKSSHVCQLPACFNVDRVTDVDFYHEAEDRLKNTFRRTSLVSVGASNFCIDEPNSQGTRETQCFGRDGTALAAALPEDPSLVGTNPSGFLYTEAIDSFIPRCRWHRIRINAELPPDTAFEIAVATSEVNDLPSQNGKPNEKKPFRPHDLDWQPPATNVNDLLIDQPPGRFLFVRIKLTGTTNATPVIRRVRIDFPRVTSLEQLPAVYRDDAEAEDFTERFLSLFDTTIEDLDRAIGRFPALLDPDGVPDEVLSWLGTFLGIVFDSEWDAELRRKLLKATPDLYRMRGTVAGLRKALEFVFGYEPGRVVIDEHAFHRAWGVVKQNAHLGSFRLFGKSKSRFRVGRSPLGATPLRSFGNPDHDPVRADAHRFTVMMPPTRTLQHFGVDRLNQLIEHQKPAHTQHQLRIGGQGFIIGHRSAIGIDTQFVAPPPVVLALGDDDEHKPIPLGTGVLRPGPNRPTSPIHIGVSSAIGIHTQLE